MTAGRTESILIFKSKHDKLVRSFYQVTGVFKFIDTTLDNSIDKSVI